jgi:hypothetical protein
MVTTVAQLVGALQTLFTTPRATDYCYSASVGHPPE